MSFFWGNGKQGEGPEEAQEELEELQEPVEELVEEPVEELRKEAIGVPELTEAIHTTTIAKGLTVTGDLTGQGSIRVEGRVEGRISLQGMVVVTPSGCIKGPVSAVGVKIAGHIEGNVAAQEIIELKRVGTIDGDITAPNVIIERGGCLNGRSTMERGKRGARESQPSIYEQAAE